MSPQFFASLESQAVSAKYPKAKEEPSIVTHEGPGRQNSEGFGGGNRVGK